MGVITLKLSDEFERMLREKAARVYGLARGSLSRAVEDALALWLQSEPSGGRHDERVRYVALRNGRALVEAQSLKELARKMKKSEINPRDVEIRSSPGTPAVEKLGLRIFARSE